jgi:hypothetical protein
MRFEVLFGDAIIGWSEFELGDPPMGVAYGRFLPSELYLSSAHAGPAMGLRIRLDEGEEGAESAGGVHIEDLSADFGPEEIEVSIVGLDADTYARFFPHHVEWYEKQSRLP